MRTRSPLLAIILLLILVSACIAGFLAYDSLMNLPAQAAQIYGPPAPNLSLFTEIRLASRLLRRHDALLKPVSSNPQEQIFSIELGESPGSILLRLHESGLIPDQSALRDYLIYKGFDTRLQAGAYLLSPTMTPVQIAEAMLDATPAFVSFNVLAGWRIEEIAAALPTSGLAFSPEDFLDAAFNIPPGYSFSAQIPANQSLEGFLLPDSYQVAREADPQEFIAVLLDNFEDQVTNALREGFVQQGLSLYEAVTIASIVQREAVVVEERPTVASVFLNRVAAGIKLDADPTVQYAVGFNQSQNTWWTNPLSLADLQFDSPYNTYLYSGFPPGPIASPSLSALEAVAFPAQTEYYYFRAACDGSGRHRFAVSFEEHQANACP